MDGFSAGFDISASRFIFSEDWLLLGGSYGTNGCIQIRSNEYLNGVDGIKRFEARCNYLLDGAITCLELCTIERLGKTVVLAGGVRSSSGAGFVEVLDLRIGKKTDLIANPSFDFLRSLLSDIAGVTSIVCKADREILILSTEAGEVIVIDLYQAKIVHRETIDATGISKVQLTITGKLATLGSSSTSPVKVWDLSFSESQEVLKLSSDMQVPICSPLNTSLSFQEPLSKAISSSSKSVSFENLSQRTDLQRTALQAEFTCMTVHPTQDRILLGNSNGVIVLWDLRMNSTVAFQTHSSRVNSIVIHPDDVAQVISASTDGMVKQTNTRKMPTTAPVTVYATSDHHLLTDIDVFTLFQRDFSINSLDCDSPSRSILVNAEFGQMFRLSMR